jgi:Cdc6-like AAA superfamily ATPase
MPLVKAWAMFMHAFKSLLYISSHFGGAISEDIVDEISEITSETGDIRRGLEILRACAKVCRIEKKNRMDEDTLKKAVEIVGSSRIILKVLAIHKSLCLHPIF